MTELKKGDRVTVKVDDRPAFNGAITGEGRSGHWWMVLKDGTKHAIGYHKDFCGPEAAPLSHGGRT
jgi:hypothetical protein